MNLKKAAKWAIFGLLTLIFLFVVYALTPRVSHRHWGQGQELPRKQVLDEAFQQELRHFIRDTASRMQTIMVAHHGQVIFEEGIPPQLINLHSARKSVMSLLIGIAQEKGLLRLDETLAELGIDESRTPLTSREQSATIRDLLMSRSGIFINAEGQHDQVEDFRPKRGQYAPGEYFFYNNFDFNVLGQILEMKSGMSIGEFTDQYLAKPLQMQDFHPSHVVFNSPWPVPSKTNSDYPVYWMFMSPRDFLKIGILVNQKGKWGDQQIVPKSWLRESFQPYSDLAVYDGMYYPYEYFTYSWWLERDSQTLWADGYSGQFMCIDTLNQLVVMQRNFSGNSLLTSGLFLMDKNRDNNPKSDLIHLYERIKDRLGLLPSIN